MQTILSRAHHFNGPRNTDWPVFHHHFADSPIPDMPFCLVPVGSFIMGAEDLVDWSKPAHLQTIPRPYWIAQYPVTNRQWQIAVSAGVVSEPSEEEAWLNPLSLQWYHDPTMADAPIVGISWSQAHQFAHWIGGRLPTECEWEYAARGVESWIYPWGNEWQNGDRVIWHGNSGGQPHPVTHTLGGQSWIGADHLSGNVWEWCSSLFDQDTYPYPYQADDGREDPSTNETRVIRGASWFNQAMQLHTADRTWGDPWDQTNDIGFRCVRAIAD